MRPKPLAELTRWSVRLGDLGDGLELGAVVVDERVEEGLGVGASHGDVLIAPAVVDYQVLSDDDGAASVDYARFAFVFVPLVGLSRMGAAER